MNRTRPLVRAGAALAAAALLVPSGPAPAARARTRAGTVQMTVDSVTPSTPSPSQGLQPLVVTLTLTNTTGAPLTGVRVVAERGDPIAGQQALDASLANPVPPTTPGVAITPTKPVVVDLPNSTSVDVTFTTTTGIPTTAGLCLCAKAEVYPLFFSAHTTVNGVDQVRGVVATYIPSFYQPPQPLRVSWIWPLLEPPHRFTGGSVFTDDSLAASVGNGRLSRALSVVEQVGATVPLTLLIDPELLDELEVMATEPYTVQPPGGKAVPGTGRQAAVQWLDRLRQVLVSDPGVGVELTAYGDPDVESLTQRGLGWSATMPATMAARVSNALAGRPMDTALAWPVTGAIGRATLRRLVAQGVSTVVLDSSAVRPKQPAAAVPAGLARLRAAHDVAAILTTPAVEADVADAVSAGGEGTAALPDLIAELAVRAAQEPDIQHSVTLLPPRYVDPDVPSAVRTIEDTSRSTFSRPLSVAQAVSGSLPLLPTEHSRLAQVPQSAVAGAPATLAAAVNAAAAMPAIRTLLDTRDDTSAAALVSELPTAIQRAESAAWRAPANRGAEEAYAAQLSAEINGLMNGVHIVRPTSGSYTLASSTSPLPITVTNQLPYEVRVRIHITTVPVGLPGFRPTDIGEQTIEARQTRTFNIRTTTDRTGRILIQATLRTPNGYGLGTPVNMTVHSTALGLIGVIITVVAGLVLALALLWRVIRRLRTRRTPAAGPTGAVALGTPEPVP